MGDELQQAVAPVVEALGLELVDLELRPGLLRVVVDRQGGVDLDSVSEATRQLSGLLDRHDPMPGRRYTLEVSSPGLERPLRTPEQFSRALGEQIMVRTQPDSGLERRVKGVLSAADAGRNRRRAAGGRSSDRVCRRGTRAHGFRVGPRSAPRLGSETDVPEHRFRCKGQPDIKEGGGLMSKTNFEFLDALSQIARDKGISPETLLDALANALVAAYKRRPGAAEEAFVTIDPESGEIRVYGQELDEDGNVVQEWDDTPEDFGRIAAQTAKQVILQRIREAERDLKYEEYAGREGDIVTGIVQQTDNRYTLLDLGKVEALLPQAEQVPYERYEHGARLKAYIVEVRKTTKGPQIVVSRSHPGLVKRLFELEVPEISSGVVEIKAAAREPGHRTKIAVWSNDPNVDPVGACVGARGSRVRMVTNELRGERIDVVPFSDDPAELIQAGLQPARVREVRLDDDTGTATVVVSDYQLSLAIGKEGQNARLAARLTGWRVDIKSETQLAEEEAGYGEEWAEGEWVQNAAGEMVWQPAEGGEAVSAAEWSRAAEAPEPPAGEPAQPAAAAETDAAPITASADGAAPVSQEQPDGQEGATA
jgi:N utilization substance protein A